MANMSKDKDNKGVKHEAMERAKEKHKMKKVHHSSEYCKHCGEKTSSSTRHESGHREYDHEREGMK